MIICQSIECLLQNVAGKFIQLPNCIVCRYDINVCSRCFQETLLAPRSLYFLRDRIYWQCRFYHADEIFPSGVFSTFSVRSTIIKPANRGVSSSRMPKESRNINWQRFVIRYSRGSLTYWKDRLVALSGIAQVHCRNHDIDLRSPEMTGVSQHYLAGLWRADLVEQLLWRTKEPRRRPEVPYAPTWSWASADAEIWFEGSAWLDVQTNFTILDARTVLLTVDEYGAVDSGVLRLRYNSLISVSIIWNKREKVHNSVHGEKVLSSRFWMDADPHGVGLKELFALHGWKETTPGNEYENMFGLLLSPTIEDSVYQRVGMYYLLCGNNEVFIYDHTLSGRIRRLFQQFFLSKKTKNKLSFQSFEKSVE